jgi:metallo-beta-lactamase class B
MKTIALSLLVMLAQLPALSATDSPESLAARGLQAGHAYPGLGNVCDLSRPLITAGQRPPSAERDPARQQRQRPERNQGDIITEPSQVFDNLYFVGTRGVTSWVVKTSDGLVVIDALNNEKEAKTFIEEGMLKLGLDPKQIKYLIITHAHGDHYGGQQYLVDTYKPRVVMSEADWQVLEDPNQQIWNPRWGKAPVRDMSVKDGDTITLGDTTIRLYVTPGHTPGTLSLLLPLKDGATTHEGALWGGTGLNFGPNEERLRQYSASAARFGELAAQSKVDVFLSNHPTRDGALDNIARLKERASGAPHPFVKGEDALGAFELLSDCALAQAEKINVKP